MHQTSLPVGNRRAHRNHDYTDVFPENVWPTGDLDVLERGSNLLFIKSYEYKKKMPQPHQRIWRLMVKYGNNPDAPGSVTVVCVWGLGQTPREWLVYDAYTNGDKVIVGSLDEWRSWLRAWWSLNGKHR